MGPIDMTSGAPFPAPCGALGRLTALALLCARINGMRLVGNEVVFENSAVEGGVRLPVACCRAFLSLDEPGPTQSERPQD